MTDKRKEYEEKFAAQLEEWKAEIALLKGKADKAGAEAKADYYRTIESLQVKYDAAKMKLQQLRSVGDDAWEDLKTGAENVWADVKAAFNSAASRFK